MGSGPEKRLVERIRKAVLAEEPSALLWKIHGGPYQETGIPDLLGGVEGILLGIEVKCRQPGESDEAMLRRVTSQQKLQIRRILDAGGMAGVASSVEEALDIVRRAKELRNR